MIIEAENIGYQVKERKILDQIEFMVKKGSFLAVLGENGAGKTTLLDILMGFRSRNTGRLRVMGDDPEKDSWQCRSKISYLSEKIDFPGDWNANDYLDFNRFFYPKYDDKQEKNLMETFRIDYQQQAGNLSAGELRRLQIVAGLASRPDLIIIDEITALLDILARRRFLAELKNGNNTRGLTVILATNIPEELEMFADSVLLLHRGKELEFMKMVDFLGSEKTLVDAVVRRLEQ